MTAPLETLRQHNLWRRGEIDDAQDPKVIGDAIDSVIAEVERLRVVTETALTTLEQIAATPRNRGAKRSANATAMFLRTQMDQAK